MGATWFSFPDDWFVCRGLIVHVLLFPFFGYCNVSCVCGSSGTAIVCFIFGHLWTTAAKLLSNDWEHPQNHPEQFRHDLSDPFWGSASRFAHFLHNLCVVTWPAKMNFSSLCSHVKGQKNSESRRGKYGETWSCDLESHFCQFMRIIFVHMISV